MTQVCDCTQIPGSYATLEDLSQAGLPPATLSSVDFGTQQSALVRASRYADTYLRDRYLLPLSAPFDESLIDAVCQIASWRLLSRRGFNPSNPGDLVVRQMFDDANDFLRRIANGQNQLCVIQTVPGSAQPDVSSQGDRGYDGVTPDFVGPNSIGF